MVKHALPCRRAPNTLGSKNVAQSLFAAVKIVLLCCAATFMKGVASAADDARATVIMPVWGLTLQENGEGLYNKLFQFLLADKSDQYVIKYVPYEEALRLLVYGTVDCAYPIPKSELDIPFAHVSYGNLDETRPVFISYAYVFSRSGDPVISSYDEMRDKVMIQIEGENYNHDFSSLGVEMVNVASETEKVELLMTGRAHAMIASMPDILYSFRALKIEPFAHNMEFALMDYPNVLTCHRSKRTRALMEHFNARIAATLADGGLKAFAIDQGVSAEIVDNFLPQ